MPLFALTEDLLTVARTEEFETQPDDPAGKGWRWLDTIEVEVVETEPDEWILDVPGDPTQAIHNIPRPSIRELINEQRVALDAQMAVSWEAGAAGPKSMGPDSALGDRVWPTGIDAEMRTATTIKEIQDGLHGDTTVGGWLTTMRTKWQHNSRQNGAQPSNGDIAALDFDAIPVNGGGFPTGASDTNNNSINTLMLRQVERRKAVEAVLRTKGLALESIEDDPANEAEYQSSKAAVEAFAAGLASGWPIDPTQTDDGAQP